MERSDVLSEVLEPHRHVKNLEISREWLAQPFDLDSVRTCWEMESRSRWSGNHVVTIGILSEVFEPRLRLHRLKMYHDQLAR